MLKTIQVAAATLLLAFTAVHADVGTGGANAKRFAPFYAMADRLIANVVTLNKWVIKDDYNKEKQVAAKAELEKSIIDQIAGLDDYRRGMFYSVVSRRHDDLKAKLLIERDQKLRDDLDEKLKAYQTLRELVDHERLTDELIQTIIALNKIVITDDASKEKQLAAKVELEKTITDKIAKLQEYERKAVLAKATLNEVSLDAQLKAEQDQAKKDALQEKLKAHQTLRERFLHASLDSDDGMADGNKHRTLFAGLALAMAFVSAGLMFSRKNALR